MDIEFVPLIHFWHLTGRRWCWRCTTKAPHLNEGDTQKDLVFRFARVKTAALGQVYYLQAHKSKTRF